MPGLLLASIGQRDPYVDDEPTGPVRAALSSELQVQRAYLYAHPDVRPQAGSTQEVLAKAAIDASLVLLPNADPTDTNELMSALTRHLPEPRDDETVHVCATSGTPQLGLALTLAVTLRYPQARHWQALDPARAAPPYLREFNPDVLRHTAEVEQAVAALKRMQAGVSLELFERRCQSSLSSVRRRLPVLRGARALSAALVAADNLDQNGARAAFSGLQARTFERLPALRTLADWYEGLYTRATERNPRWPLELLAVAERARRREHFAAALLGAAVAYEVGLATRLRTEFDVDPDWVPDEKRPWIEANQGRLRRGLRDGLLTSDGRRIQGLEARASVLALFESEAGECGPPEGHRVLTEARNKLVHEARQPAVETVDVCLAFVRDRFHGWGWLPSACPTTPAAIGELADAIRAALV